MAKDQFKLAVERQRRICEMLSAKESVTTAEICAALGVSPVTARNDLAVLEQEGKLVRVRGGATIIGQSKAITAPRERETINLAAKRTIAQLAAARVHDGDSILMDSGTTTLELVRAISSKRDLTVVTNDIRIVELSDRLMPDAAFVLLGGLYRHGHRLTYGTFALSTLDDICVDMAFMCPTGFSLDLGCMTEHETSAPVKTAFLRHARHRYLLLDTSKIGRSSFISFARVPDFEEIFLEKDPGPELRKLADENGVRLSYPTE